MTREEQLAFRIKPDTHGGILLGCILIAIYGSVAAGVWAVMFYSFGPIAATASIPLWILIAAGLRSAL